jgi:hypothetical protein
MPRESGLYKQSDFNQFYLLTFFKGHHPLDATIAFERRLLQLNGNMRQ